MGDCFFNGRYPFIDVSSGGSIDGMIAAADHVLALANAETKIIPGHGPVGDRESLKAFREMLVTVRSRIKPMLAAKKTPEQVQTAKPTRDLDDKWGGGFLKPEQFVGIVYESLSKGKTTR